MTAAITHLSRRTFLKTGTATCTLTALPAPLLASVFQITGAATSRRLEDQWEFYRGPLDPGFQVGNSEELVRWEHITVPHCFNAYDACDPDLPAYRGPGWYRTHLALSNP